MFAVLKTGGKQYRVAANDILTVEKLPAEAGETVEFTEVLMLGGDEVKVGHMLLQHLGLRQPTFDVYACPSCGRAEVDLIGLNKAVEEATKDLTYPCRVAVMGCIVNGPGEAADADVSISAGRGFGFIYRGSKMIKKVAEADLVKELRAEIDAWIAEKKAAEVGVD